MSYLHQICSTSFSNLFKTDIMQVQAPVTSYAHPSPGRYLPCLPFDPLTQSQVTDTITLSGCPPNTATQAHSYPVPDMPHSHQPDSLGVSGLTLQWSEAYSIQNMSFRTIDLQKTLLNCQVDIDNRAQMVDWMFEVLSVLQKTFSFATFFRSVSLLDLFLKRTHTSPTNDHLHLIGVTCMYISSKYEDIYPLSMSHFVKGASQNKFNSETIRRQENQILQTISFSLSFKSAGEVLDHFMFLIFGSQHQLTALLEKARCFLVYCLLNVRFNDYEIKFLVFTCLVLAGRYMEQWALSFQSGQKGEAWTRAHKLISVYMRSEVIEGGLPEEIDLLIDCVKRYLLKVAPNLNLCEQLRFHMVFNPINLS